MSDWGREVEVIEQPKVRRKQRLKVVEVEKPSPANVLDEETSNALTGLETNPGFVALMAKLRLRKAILETLLKTKKHDSLREVDYLQLGVQWCEWLNDEVQAEVSRRKRREKPRDAFEVEQREFNRMLASLEVVGK